MTPDCKDDDDTCEKCGKEKGEKPCPPSPIPDDPEDCKENPEDPKCKKDCKENPDDPECKDEPCDIGKIKEENSSLPFGPLKLFACEPKAEGKATVEKVYSISEDK